MKDPSTAPPLPLPLPLLGDNACKSDTFFRTTFVPLLLMILSPPAVQFVWIVCYYHDGNITQALAANHHQLWLQFPTPTATAAIMVFSFLALQLALLIAVPGAKFTAIPTPMGNRPTYKLNGLPCMAITHLVLLASSYFGVLRYSALYDHFGPMLSFLSKNALLGTVLLYFRGIHFPTNSDSGVTGYGVVWDMWHGTELHPEVLGVSLKQLINCRFAMMGWSVAVIAFAIKQVDLYGRLSNSMLVSTLLQTIYIVKFFYWEDGYFNSVDIIHDRFGFYIFWGCSAFLPSIYTLTSFYLTTHPTTLPPAIALAITTVGLSSVACNYWADSQRQSFRATHGTGSIWGSRPRMITAQYMTGNGKMYTSLLLASGWWGVSRHMNYVFEIVLALCWSLPAGIGGWIPYVYVAFLTILLTDRAYRDEVRCSLKYGRFYDEYCRMVPWKMIPGVY